MVLEDASFSIPNGVILVKLPHTFSSACCARAIGITHELFGACSARISGDRHTDTQNDYRNPHCACPLRVNYRPTVAFIMLLELY